MATVRIPNTLRPLAGGSAELLVGATDLGAALDEIRATHPELAERLTDETGRLYGFVNLFVDAAECRTLDGLATALEATTIVSIVPAVAGGSLVAAARR